jgi:hypothetical protein
MTPSSRTLLRALLAGTVLLTNAACTTRVADLTVVSTKNIDLSNVSIDTRQGRRMEGSDCAFWPLGIPFKIPTIETAVDRALEAGGGNLMIDQVTYARQYTFIIASYVCLETEGTVLSTTPAE